MTEPRENAKDRDRRRARPKKEAHRPEAEKADRVEKTEKIEKADKLDKPEKVDRLEKVEKADKVEKTERPDKLEKVEKVEKPENLPNVQKEGQPSPPVQTSVETAAHVRAPDVSGPVPRPTPTAEPTGPESDYTVQCFFDKTKRQFVSEVVEFPDVRAIGISREAANKSVEALLIEKVDELRDRGESLPEALNVRRYPDRLEVGISQGLYRKLDRLSRSERVGLDELVNELLSVAIDRRTESFRPQADRRPPQPQPQPDRQQRPPHHQQQQHSQRHQHRNSGRPQGRQYHNTMQNRESFIDYVRNLEKNQGGGWKKR